MALYTVSYSGEITIESSSKAEAREEAESRLSALENAWIEEIEVA